MPSPPLRVLIVDDDPDIRDLLKRFIAARVEEMEVVGEAVDGRDGLDKWRELRPDVLVVDHVMPNMTGMELVRLVLTETPAQQVVVCSGQAEEIEGEAVELGVAVVVNKLEAATLPDLIAALPRTS